ncbi:HTH-type transcriptional activator mta [Paenibacillus konkukensis]|uniref:HTH-type transcriptional activator mta n=1 Tax=Paenibacillus konkukensis TaxID=2020716 RepID=A0ABY4RRV7_9BACL|nr:MerR family transcriptional regulator [Paenibacillus konkukensis]UQZ84677.1 HTH-type transcriptional activator mta [Paenibacillus konkukensis]
MYTVKEVAGMTNITVKTLHHYHKIGLLEPCQISEAGYRLYGMKELERLQQILFYRELDFPLEQIQQLLDQEPERLAILSAQQLLLTARMERLQRLLETLRLSIDHARKGEKMSQDEMFAGFATEEQWTEALEEQRQYLQETYDYDLAEQYPVDVAEMNEQAAEAKRFMDGMAEALRSGRRVDDEQLQALIEDHLAFLNRHGHAIGKADFAAQCRFFLGDDFHRSMLESQQTGLAYYLCLAAEAFAQDI